MSAVWVSSSARLPDFLRTTTFRWTLGVSGAFAACMLAQELRVFAAYAPEQRLAQIEDYLRQDPRRIRIVGLFGADMEKPAGRPCAGRAGQRRGRSG
jgi:hypothetical protein